MLSPLNSAAFIKSSNSRDCAIDTLLYIVE